MAYLAWVIMWEATALPSAHSSLLLYGDIKEVSNGRARFATEVIFVAINLLDWCAVGGVILPSLSCLLLLSAHTLVISPLVLDRGKRLREESPEVDGPPWLLLSSLREQG